MMPGGASRFRSRHEHVVIPNCHASRAHRIMLFEMLRNELSAIAARVAPRTLGRLSLARRLTQYCSDRLSLPQSIVLVPLRRDSLAERHIVAIDRNGNRIKIACQEGMILERPNELHQRLIGLLTIVLGGPPKRFQAVADLSDGEESGAGMISFCSRDPGAILIPDHGFVRTRGQANHRRVAHANRTGWTKRSDRIVWRGLTTGCGAISKPQLSEYDPELLQRVRLCLALRDVPGTDAKFSGIAQSRAKALDVDRLIGAGILGEYISPIAWNGFKFAIDIDGNTNAFSNLLTRLIMGCCVLKIASPLGYRQWYYDEMEPWTHYVPVSAGLSDLRDRIAWCRANLAECERIAARGQTFAMARDYDTEVASAICRLCAAQDSGALRTTLS
jgi:hypothetical protein